MIPNPFSNTPTHKKEYTFIEPKDMDRFVNNLRANPFVSGVEYANKDTLSVSVREQGVFESIDKFYKEDSSNEALVIHGKEKKSKITHTHHGSKPGSRPLPSQDPKATERNRKAKMDKIKGDEEEIRARKRREIQRSRDADQRERERGSN